MQAHRSLRPRPPKVSREQLDIPKRSAWFSLSPRRGEAGVRVTRRVESDCLGVSVPHPSPSIPLPSEGRFRARVPTGTGGACPTLDRMDEHFRAFSFVDRITSVEPGVRIRGSYAIPPDLDSFSHSLVAEAVGQLAAWAAMAAVDFKRRPVAGLAGRIELLAPVRPGQMLELAAELETVDTEAVAYGGTASAEGVPVIRLEHCVGPMMPMEDFDDPQAMRERFGRFCRERRRRAVSGACRRCGSNPAPVKPANRRATFHVPDSARILCRPFSAPAGVSGHVAHELQSRTGRPAGRRIAGSRARRHAGRCAPFRT